MGMPLCIRFEDFQNAPDLALYFHWGAESSSARINCVGETLYAIRDLKKDSETLDILKALTDHLKKAGLSTNTSWYNTKPYAVDDDTLLPEDLETYEKEKEIFSPFLFAIRKGENKNEGLISITEHLTKSFEYNSDDVCYLSPETTYCLVDFFADEFKEDIKEDEDDEIEIFPLPDEFKKQIKNEEWKEVLENYNKKTSYHDFYECPYDSDKVLIAQ